MTAFYMFRALFMTFFGEFRGWTIARVSRPSLHGEGHGGDEGPPPHESPWTMTIPLLVLAAFALVGGIFNLNLISKNPSMEKWLEPVFEGAETFVKVPENATSPWLLAVPGMLACFIGIGAAYYVYIQKNGAPAKMFTEKVPGLYRLVLDKWRIDELYENTVIAGCYFP